MEDRIHETAIALRDALEAKADKSVFELRLHNALNVYVNQVGGAVIEGGKPAPRGPLPVKDTPADPVDKMTLAELKAEAKARKVKGWALMKEDKLRDILKA